MYIVEQSFFANDAEAAKVALLAALDDHEAYGFAIDFSGPEPSQISLQICLAALKEMDARSIEPKPGEVLKEILMQDTAPSEAG